MNSKTWAYIITLALLAALALPLQLAAQAPAQPQHQYHHYQLVDVGTFGGPQSFLYLPGLPAPGVLNNRGQIAGTADRSAIDPICQNHPPDCYASDGFIWKNGVKADLGILPGGTNSQVNWISSNGLTTGVDDLNQTDPLLGIPIQLHGIFWDHDGAMTDVGALPGTNFAFPSAVNSRGEVVGQGLDTIPDPNGIYGWGFESRAFYWKDGAMQDLGTLGTGTNAIAQMINDSGQVVGWSYTSSDPAPLCYLNLTTGTFIWDKKNGMRDIGGLGGTCTVAIALNNKGQIVGGSTVPGDLEIHAFVWDVATWITELPTTAGLFADARAINENGEAVGWGDIPSGTARDAMLWQKRGGKWQVTDLGRLNDPDCAVGTSINSSGQVLGYSGTGGGCVGAAFVWEDGGPIVDLNTLVPPNSGIQLSETGQINDRGEIAAQGPDADGNNHAVLLIPCDENHPGVVGCDYSLVDASAAAQTTTPRFLPRANQHLQQPWRMNRFHLPGHALVGGAAAIATQVSPVPEFTHPPPPFSVSSSPLTPNPVNPGGSSTSSVTAGAGPNSVGTATLTCSVQPAPPLAPTCSISPSSVAFLTPATLTVHTTGPSGALRAPGSGFFYALWLPLIGLVATGLGLGSHQNGQKEKLKTVLLACALFVGLGFQIACGGGPGSSGTPSGTYAVTITADDGCSINCGPVSTLITLQVQ